MRFWKLEWGHMGRISWGWRHWTPKFLLIVSTEPAFLSFVEQCRPFLLENISTCLPEVAVWSSSGPIPIASCCLQTYNWARDHRIPERKVKSVTCEKAQDAPKMARWCQITSIEMWSKCFGKDPNSFVLEWKNCNVVSGCSH